MRIIFDINQGNLNSSSNHHLIKYLHDSKGSKFFSKNLFSSIERGLNKLSEIIDENTTQDEENSDKLHKRMKRASKYESKIYIDIWSESSNGVDKIYEKLHIDEDCSLSLTPVCELILTYCFYWSIVLKSIPNSKFSNSIRNLSIIPEFYVNKIVLTNCINIDKNNKFLFIDKVIEELDKLGYKYESNKIID